METGLVETAPATPGDGTVRAGGASKGGRWVIGTCGASGVTTIGRRSATMGWEGLTGVVLTRAGSAGGGGPWIDGVAGVWTRGGGEDVQVLPRL